MYIRFINWSCMYRLHSKIISEKDLGHTVFLLRNDGIVLARCADNFTYEIEHFLENFEYLRTLATQDRLLIINCCEPYTNISAVAREFLRKGAHSDIIKAEAYVIHSLAQKLMAQFFVTISKPVVRANFFTDFREAEKWIFKFRSEE